MSKQEPRQPQQARGNSSKLYETYVDCEISLKRFLRNFLKKPEDIEELAQEAFLRTFTVELQQEIKSPKAYLFVVA